MSTQQEIENPSTSHEIGRFIEKKFWISAERKERFENDTQGTTIKGI